MPPKPKRIECPLLWWNLVRSTANLNRSSFPLNLGVLHRIVFPERRELSNYWHNAGVDVTMTKELIEAYFHIASNRPIPGKVDSYMLIDPDLPSFSENKRMPDGSAQVAVIDEESEEFDDDMLDAEIDQIDMEEDDFFDEYVLGREREIYLTSAAAARPLDRAFLVARSGLGRARVPRRNTPFQASPGLNYTLLLHEAFGFPKVPFI
jgi:hypothetical protein